METVQTNRRMGRKTGLCRRCRSHQKIKTAKPASINASYDFLKQDFPLVTDLALNNSATIAEIEEQYYKSLDHLARLYRFRPKLYKHFSYPFNIAKSYEHAKQRLSKKDHLLELIIVSKDDNSICLATAREYDTNSTLLMMPMNALTNLHQQKNFDAFNLLLSCYAYLYQITGMELCDRHSYIMGCYEMNLECIENEESFMEEQEFKSYCNLYTNMKRYLRILNREVKNKVHLDLFGQRIDSFEPVSYFDKLLIINAQKLFSLFTRYPTRSFIQNSSAELLHESVEQMGYIHQYFTFCWTTEGLLIDQYLDYANADLQECEAMDQPIALQFFDEPQAKPIHDFLFEEALQDAICSFAETLNQLT